MFNNIYRYCNHNSHFKNYYYIVDLIFKMKEVTEEYNNIIVNDNDLIKEYENIAITIIKHPSK